MNGGPSAHLHLVLFHACQRCLQPRGCVAVLWGVCHLFLYAHTFVHTYIHSCSSKTKLRIVNISFPQGSLNDGKASMCVLEAALGVKAAAGVREHTSVPTETPWTLGRGGHLVQRLVIAFHFLKVCSIEKFCALIKCT